MAERDAFWIREMEDCRREEAGLKAKVEQLQAELQAASRSDSERKDDFQDRRSSDGPSQTEVLAERNRVSELEQQLADGRCRISELERDIAGISSECEGLQSRLREAEEDRQRVAAAGAAETAELKRLLDAASKAADAALEEGRQTTAECEALKASLNAAEGEARIAEEEAAVLRQADATSLPGVALTEAAALRVDALNEQLRVLTETLATQRAQAEEVKQGLEDRLALLEREADGRVESALRKLAEAEGQLGEAVLESSNLRAETVRMEQLLAEANGELDVARRELAEARSEVEGHRRDSERLAAHVEELRHNLEVAAEEAGGSALEAPSSAALEAVRLELAKALSDLADERSALQTAQDELEGIKGQVRIHSARGDYWDGGRSILCIMHYRIILTIMMYDLKWGFVQGCLFHLLFFFFVLGRNWNLRAAFHAERAV